MTECVFPKFICWSFTPQYRGMSRWKLSEVIRIRWDDVRGAILGGIWALTRVMRELMSSLCSPPGENITRIWQFITQERALTRTSHDGTLVWNLQNLWEKKMVITLSVYGTLLEQLKLRQSPQQVSQKHHVTHISYKEHQWPSDRQSSYLSLVLIQLPNFFLCHLKSWSFLCETCLLSVATLSWSSYLHVVVTSSSVLYAFLQAHSLKGLTSVSPHCSPRTIFLCRGLGCVLQKDAEILTLSVCECDLIWK